ncbi:MAG: hypothetical protein WCA07_03005 [Gloeobacterales cyanobacterium]
MYKTVLPKKSASVRKDESMDSASTPYARYEGNTSATGEGRSSMLVKFRDKEFKQVFEERFLLSNFNVMGQNNERLSERLSGLDPSTVKLVQPIPNYPKKDFIAWGNYRSKSADAPSKADNLYRTATDKQPIQTVQNRLTALYHQEEEECNISKPTDHSFNTAWKLVTEASELRGKYFQKATVATDDEGGIRLRWRNPNKDREVRLYCPANTTKKMYIYHEEGDSYRAEYNVSGRTLAEWLYWLSDA